MGASHSRRSLRDMQPNPSNNSEYKRRHAKMKRQEAKKKAIERQRALERRLPINPKCRRRPYYDQHKKDCDRQFWRRAGDGFGAKVVDTVMDETVSMMVGQSQVYNGGKYISRVNKVKTIGKHLGGSKQHLGKQ